MTKQPTAVRNATVAAAAKAYFEAWMREDDAVAAEAALDVAVKANVPAARIPALYAAGDAYIDARRNALEAGQTWQLAAEAARIATIQAYHATPDDTEFDELCGENIAIEAAAQPA